jgi:hypothetical protein
LKIAERFGWKEDDPQRHTPVFVRVSIKRDCGKMSLYPSRRLGAREYENKGARKKEACDEDSGRGGTLSRVFCKRVRICVISKDLVNTLDAKSDERVRKCLISKELMETSAFECEVSEKAPLPFGRGKKELEEIEEVQEAASAASRRFIRDAKAALRRG